ncbi:hypothetical protein ACP4OV_010767 [Aristida adscensionis]
MTTSDFVGPTSRFAVACGVLSRRVRGEAAARPAGAASSAATMLLMPGADVRREEEPADAPAPAPAQLMIVYGGRVLVYDGVAPDAAAKLLRAAAAASSSPPPRAPAADMPVARKASLQRFMEKRRDRLAARAPYAVPARRPSPSPAESRMPKAEASGWLRLGVPGGCAC